LLPQGDFSGANVPLVQGHDAFKHFHDMFRNEHIASVKSAKESWFIFEIFCGKNVAMNPNNGRDFVCAFGDDIVVGLLEKNTVARGDASNFFPLEFS